MTSFLKKCALFFLVWVAIFVVGYLLIPYKYYARSDYDLVQTVVKKMRSNNLKGNILIGDSKPLMGVNAKTIHAYNFAFGAETPIEGFYEVREILNNPTNHIDTVFLSYSHKHFILQECFYSNSYYYSAFDTQYLDSARQVALSYNDINYNYTPIFPILQYVGLNSPANNHKIDRVYQFVTSGFNDIVEYYRTKKAGHVPNSDDQLVNGRLAVKSSDMSKFDRTKNQAPVADEDLSYVIPSKVNTIYFQKILDFCKKKHVHVTFIHTPSLKFDHTKSLNRHIDSLRTLFGKDFIQDTTQYPDSLFRDNYGHLNVYGINRFQAFLEKKLYGVNKPKP